MKKKKNGSKSKENKSGTATGTDTEELEIEYLETPEQLTQITAIDEGTQAKPHDIIIPKQTIGIPINYKGFKNRLLSNAFKDKTFVINMQLRNGKHKTMLVRTKKNYFKYQEGTYIIDDSLAYDNISSKFLMLDYHQDFVLPIKRSIEWKEIQEAIESSGLYEIENSTNPSALTKLLEADIGGGVARASAMPDFIKQMRLLVIIAAASSLILLILFVFKTGMLSGVKIPGL